MESQTKKSFRLVLLGSSAVGKSSLVYRYIKNDFHEFQETIGAAFLQKSVVLDDENTVIDFEIWDTAGHSGLKSEKSVI